MKHFKDKILVLVDGSRSEIPNTPESKEWANIEDDSLTNKKAARTLFSTIIDSYYGTVLDAIMAESDASERDLFKQHFENIKDIVDLNDLVVVVDGGYFSLELKLYLEEIGVDYIFKLPSNTYHKEISQMESRDENLKFKNIASRRRNITDPEILKKA